MSPETASTAPAEPWWRSAVVYQIYPRSFARLRRRRRRRSRRHRRRRLDHLAGLGVDAIWLSPIYRSPMADFGYDVSDYCDVDPVFGDLADLRPPARRGPRRGLRVLLDWVPNHTARPAPLVRRVPRRRATTRSATGTSGATAATAGRRTTGARRSAGPAWTLRRAHRPVVPPPVPARAARPQLGATRRSSRRCTTCCASGSTAASTASASTSSTCIGKDAGLPDQPDELAGLRHRRRSTTTRDTHELLRDIRALLDELRRRPRDRRRGATCSTPPLVARTTARRRAAPGLQLPAAARALGRPRLGARSSRRPRPRSTPVDAWPTWVLSNHDQPRHRTRYGGSEARARAAAVLLLTLRGHALPLRRRGARACSTPTSLPTAACRSGRPRRLTRPIPWDSTPAHGWAATPWLPWPPEPDVGTPRRRAPTRLDPRALPPPARAPTRLRRADARELAPARLPGGDARYERRRGADVAGLP